MKEYAVITDSACDLPAGLARKHDVDVVPFKISFDKKNRLTEGADITNDEFYLRLAAADAMPKTYNPTVGDYVEVFKKRLEQGQDVLCLCLSSKLSKSCAAALNAKKILSYTYPDNKIMVVDTLLASIGQGLLVLDAVKLKDIGVAVAYEKIEAAKKDSHMIVTVASLLQLARGGRMSSTTAAMGKLLRINPIIYLEDGALVSKSKAFGRKNALELLQKLTMKEMGGSPKNYDFSMLHSRAREEADIVARGIEAACGVKQSIPPVELGVTIGMHTGASVVATAIVRKI